MGISLSDSLFCVLHKFCEAEKIILGLLEKEGEVQNTTDYQALCAINRQRSVGMFWNL